VNEPFFNGHFPGHPVMPGVLVIEALAQAGAILACKASGFDPAKQVIYFMAIDKAKFRKPVVPGDQLHLEVVPLRKGGAIWKMRGEAKVDGQVVTEAEFLATLAPRAS
jgi:3-hydroxyacyl-[acyl-carrier-protein] dehydratase